MSTTSYRHSNRKWLRRLLSGQPHQTIGGAEHPYMLRWYVIPRNPLVNVYVHKFCRSDDDRALHDHPWWFVSLILRGRYDEITEAGTRRRRAGSIAFRPAEWRHRVALVRRGLPSAGQVVATVEIDSTAAAIGHRHFPKAHQFTDVTKVTGDELRAAGFVPDRGIVTAGWPCQDFSVAGRRAGLAGARSGLWWHVARILAEVRPRWFIGENVPGLLSSVCQCPGDFTCDFNGHSPVGEGQCPGDGQPHDVKPGGCCPGGCMETHGGAMGSVLGSLGELGYGVAYRVLDAQYFGVPQQRRRVFIVGHLGAPFGAAAQVLLEPEGGSGDSAPRRTTREDVAGPAAGGVGAAGSDVAPTLTARYGKGTDSDATDAMVVHTHTHTHLDAARRREAGTPDRRRVGSGRASHCREAVAALTSNGVGTCGADDNQAQAGHIVVQPTTVTGGVTHTLTSEGADASEDGTGRGTPIVVHDAYQCHGSNVGPMGTLRKGNGAVTGTSSPGVSAPGRRQEDDHNLVASETVVRRLTEMECTRLQGYPDGWVDGQSGSAQYRQLGNSVAVPVVEWLAQRVVMIDRKVRP